MQCGWQGTRTIRQKGTIYILSTGNCFAKISHLLERSKQTKINHFQRRALKKETLGNILCNADDISGRYEISTIDWYTCHNDNDMMTNQ